MSNPLHREVVHTRITELNAIIRRAKKAGKKGLQFRAELNELLAIRNAMRKDK